MTTSLSGRWVRGMRPREPAQRRPAYERPRARGGPQRRQGRPVHPYAAALPFPIGSRLYDWRYESEPEPHMGGRRVYHARGKVLGGSSSINGMIFQRGNPMDYERWAADPGMEHWDYAHCLPYFKRMETCTAGCRPVARRLRTACARTGPSIESALRRLPRGGPASGPSADRRRQRIPPGGLCSLSMQRAPGPAVSAARAYLHPVMGRKNLTVHTLSQATALRTEGARVVGVDYVRAGLGAASAPER